MRNSLAAVRTLIPKRSPKRGDNLVDNRARVGLGYRRKLGRGDIGRSAADPLVGTPGVGVNAEAGDLLAVAKDLDDIVFGFARVGIGKEAVELDFDFLERLSRAAEDCPLGLATKANHDSPPNGRKFRCEPFGRGVGDLGATENVDIESWVALPQNASVGLSGLRVCPAMDFVLSGLGALLPRLKRDRLTCKRHRIVSKRPHFEALFCDESALGASGLT
jgi:hypothetical protein